MGPRTITAVEQRFVPGPSLWSGRSCLVTLVHMGQLAHALTTDYPGMGEKVLSLFPGMHDFTGPLRRGAYLAEVLGRITLELQRIVGARAKSRCALTVHGRNGQVRIVTAGHVERLAVRAFELAASILLALCNGKKVSIRVRVASLTRTVQNLHSAPLWRSPACPAHAPLRAGEASLQLLHARAGERRIQERELLMAPGL